LLVALFAALSGCRAPGNAAPIVQGVPDGFVVARERIEAPRGFRGERVKFAFRNRSESAVLHTPLDGGRFPVKNGVPPPGGIAEALWIDSEASKEAQRALALTLPEAQ
jgi:hypothetical protein